VGFASNYRQIFAALLAFVSTALLVWFGSGLNPWWPLLWFAPLPVLLFALRSSWSSAALVSFLSWLVGCLDYWHYLRVQHTPSLVLLVILSVVALVFSFAVLLFRALVRRGAFWSALLAFPATWVSYE
jgi:apolipoprotein N-acyltransferase